MTPKPIAPPRAADLVKAIAGLVGSMSSLAASFMIIFVAIGALLGIPSLVDTYAPNAPLLLALTMTGLLALPEARSGAGGPFALVLPLRPWEHRNPVVSRMGRMCTTVWWPLFLLAAFAPQHLLDSRLMPFYAIYLAGWPFSLAMSVLQPYEHTKPKS